MLVSIHYHDAIISSWFIEISSQKTIIALQKKRAQQDDIIKGSASQTSNGENQCRGQDGNMTFHFVSCFNTRKEPSDLCAAIVNVLYHSVVGAMSGLSQRTVLANVNYSGKSVSIPMKYFSFLKKSKTTSSRQVAYRKNQ